MKNLLLGSEIMAKEITNLCPENIVFVETAPLTKGQQWSIEHAGMPFNSSCKYVLVPQVHHTTPFTIKGVGEVKSNRLLLAEVKDGVVRALRPISLSQLLGWFWPSNDLGGCPSVVGYWEGEIFKTDHDKCETKSRPAVYGRLPITDGNIAEVTTPVVLKYDGYKSGWITKWENGKRVIVDNTVQLEKKGFNTFTVTSEEVDADILEQVKNGAGRASTYLKL